MLNIKRLLSLTVLSAVVISSSFAASPVGSWAGKLMIKGLPILPKTATAAQKAQYDQVLGTIRDYRVALKVKADKTFVLDAPQLFTTPKMHFEGTWAQKGDVVSFKTLKQNGKAPTGKDAQTEKATLNKNGKTMIQMIPVGPGMEGKITFTKK